MRFHNTGRLWSERKVVSRLSVQAERACPRDLFGAAAGVLQFIGRTENVARPKTARGDARSQQRRVSVHASSLPFVDGGIRLPSRITSDSSEKRPWSGNRVPEYRFGWTHAHGNSQAAGTERYRLCHEPVLDEA